MVLSFSRSVRFGAFRFNGSASGIGVSAGIKGLRIGTGPRCAYISAGVGGFRYRTSAGDGRQQQVAQPSREERVGQARIRTQEQAPALEPTVVSTQIHEKVNLMDLADTSRDELLHSMNEQLRKRPRWPLLLVAEILLLGVLIVVFGERMPAWVTSLLFFLACASVWWFKYQDDVRRLTVLLFEPDAQVAEHFEAVIAGAHHAMHARRLEVIKDTSQYADTQYGAGTKGLGFDKLVMKVGQAPLVRANIDVPIATSGKTALAFYPDRILVMKSDAITAVAYQDLQIDAGQTRSVESRYCPQDATILDHTWQYVDESGGPDKRVKHNPEIPVCLYSHLRFTAPGLDVRWMASTENGFESFATALLRLSHSLQDQGSTAAPAGA